MYSPDNRRAPRRSPARGTRARREPPRRLWRPLWSAGRHCHAAIAKTRNVDATEVETERVEQYAAGTIGSAAALELEATIPTAVDDAGLDAGVGDSLLECIGATLTRIARLVLLLAAQRSQGDPALILGSTGAAGLRKRARALASLRAARDARARFSRAAGPTRPAGPAGPAGARATRGRAVAAARAPARAALPGRPCGSTSTFVTSATAGQSERYISRGQQTNGDHERLCIHDDPPFDDSNP